MKANRFFELVELPTKVASVFPFMVGTLYALYRYGRIDGINLLVMVIAMLSLDMAATALDNYMDYKRAIKTHGFNYEQQNAIAKYKLKENTVRWVIGGMVSIAMILGVSFFLLRNESFHNNAFFQISQSWSEKFILMISHLKISLDYNVLNEKLRYSSL